MKIYDKNGLLLLESDIKKIIAENSDLKQYIINTYLYGICEAGTIQDRANRYIKELKVSNDRQAKE
jgi:hypothetical protein